MIMAAKFGLTGFPVSHSRSRALFAEWGHDYELIPLEKADAASFAALLDEHPGLIGLNVTVPHKKTVATLVDRLDPTAAEAGAVNTVKIIRDAAGKVVSTIGYNTDVEGFGKALEPLLNGGITSALVLGTGGAAAAAAVWLRHKGIAVTFVSRTAGDGKIAYADLTPEIVAQNKLIVNATPLGMGADIDKAPSFPYHCLSSGHVCFDIVYNDSETAFVRNCRLQGAATASGIRMLEEQAKAALAIWLS